MVDDGADDWYLLVTWNWYCTTLKSIIIKWKLQICL